MLYILPWHAHVYPPGLSFMPVVFEHLFSVTLHGFRESVYTCVLLCSWRPFIYMYLSDRVNNFCWEQGSAICEFVEFALCKVAIRLVSAFYRNSQSLQMLSLLIYSHIYVRTLVFFDCFPYSDLILFGLVFFELSEQVITSLEIVLRLVSSFINLSFVGPDSSAQELFRTFSEKSGHRVPRCPSCSSFSAQTKSHIYHLRHSMRLGCSLWLWPCVRAFVPLSAYFSSYPSHICFRSLYFSIPALSWVVLSDVVIMVSTFVHAPC